MTNWTRTLKNTANAEAGRGMEQIKYNPISQRLHEIIKVYCAFPGPILKAQCRRMNKTPDLITGQDLPQLAEWIGQSVEAFTNPVKGRAVRAEIITLGNQYK